MTTSNCNRDTSNTDQSIAQGIEGHGISASAALYYLELGKAIQASLEARQSHSYFVALEAGQYMRVVISKDFAIALQLLSMDRRQTFLTLTLHSHREPICRIAKVSGYYRLELAELKKGAEPQPYTIELTNLRTSVPVDERRLVAQGLFDRARTALMQGQPQRDQHNFPSLSRQSFASDTCC